MSSDLPLPPVTVQIHRALEPRYGPGARQVVRWHQHLDHELLLIDAGCYTALIDGEPLTARAGELVLILPGQWHEDRLQGPLRYRSVCCTCQATTAGPSARLVRDGVAGPRVLPRDPSLVQAFDTCHRAWHGGDPLAPVIAQSAALHLIWLVAAHIPEDLRGSAYCPADPDDAFRSRLERCFALHLREQVSTATLAAHVGMSERGLRQRCQRQLGTSPGRAFTRYRLQHGADLLRSTDMSVVAIADHLGYGSPYQFSAAFKRVFGSAPAQWRSS